MNIKEFFHHAKVQQYYALCGFFIGLSVFGSFTFMIKNYAAGALGLVSGIYALSLSLCIWKSHNLQDGKVILPVVESKFRFYAKFTYALLGCVAGLGFMTVFFIQGGVMHEPVTGQSSWVSGVWGFMTFKWAFACLNHMFHYHNPGTSTFRSV